MLERYTRPEMGKIWTDQKSIPSMARSRNLS